MDGRKIEIFLRRLGTTSKTKNNWSLLKAAILSFWNSISIFLPPSVQNEATLSQEKIKRDSRGGSSLERKAREEERRIANQQTRSDHTTRKKKKIEIGPQEVLFFPLPSSIESVDQEHTFLLYTQTHTSAYVLPTYEYSSSSSIHAAT